MSQYSQYTQVPDSYLFTLSFIYLSNGTECVNNEDLYDGLTVKYYTQWYSIPGDSYLQRPEL